MTPPTSTLIIGGGIVGAALCYELARRGADVTLLEARQIAAGATGAAIGQPMAILLDGEIVSAPVVRERIAGGQLMITGGFSNERAEALKAAFDRCSEGQE